MSSNHDARPRLTGPIGIVRDPGTGPVPTAEPVHEPNHERLRQALQQPIYNRILRGEVGLGATDYEVYLQTERLLSSQTPCDELVNHDELLFQIVHQSQELWLKLFGHEAVALVREVDADELWSASATAERMKRIVCALADELHILDTLTPRSFQTIRRYLGSGSGQQSPGYNQLHLAVEHITHALERLLLTRDVGLATLYHRGEPNDVLHLCELLVDLDAAHQRWLGNHFALVRRTIGVDREIKALDGFPTKALAARMNRPLFPALWNVRAELTAKWKRAGGVPPGVARGGESTPEVRRSNG